MQLPSIAAHKYWDGAAMASAWTGTELSPHLPSSEGSYMGPPIRYTEQNGTDRNRPEQNRLPRIRYGAPRRNT